MAFQVRQETRPVSSGLDGTVYVLEAPSGARAEIWPALGCNCYRWRLPWKNHLLDLLYASPTLFAETRPTRSGIPILFPFPNRIRAGRFSWERKEYQLPPNDPSGKNAIHGFACRHPWRIVDQGADAESAWLQAEFWCSRDAPDALPQWPADHRLQLTFRLRERSLHLEALVDNPGGAPLPFGLGYHPYFRVPFVPVSEDRRCLVEVRAETYWELEDLLPTGRLLSVDSSCNFMQPRPFSELHADTLLHAVAGPEDLLLHGQLRQEPDGATLSVRASPSFREVVAFTPPHRQAFCIEPYTCITDAINAQQRGVDAGLLVLPPGQQWTGTVAMEVS
jgi:aldose 1-epimerase